MAFGRLIQGLAGNFSEQSKEALTKEFGQYLLENEEIDYRFERYNDHLVFYMNLPQNKYQTKWEKVYISKNRRNSIETTGKTSFFC